MASPFVPVDLDKLLDEFEEKEEETKPEQLASFSATDPNSKLTTRQRFQAPFPSIKEEALSDQGSEQCISDEKNSSTSSGDDSSDSDSVSGVIEAAEAITNQGSNLNQPQTILQGVNNDSVIDEHKEKVIVWDCASSESSGGSNASSSIEKSNSGSYESDDAKFSNQYGYVQLVNEDTETASEQSETVLHDDNCHVEEQARDLTEMSASGVLYSETSDELLYQEQTSAGIADEERLSIDGNKYKTNLSIVGTINDSSFGLSDPKSDIVEPEMSNIPLSTNVEMHIADKCNQGSDLLETIEEHVSNRPVLDNQHLTHPGQEIREEQINEIGSDCDRYSTELGAFGGINHNDTPSLVDSSCEADAHFAQDTVSGIPVSQDDEHTYVNSDCGPTVSAHEQSQSGQVGDPVITAVLVAIDPEVTNTSATEAQAILDDQEVASYSTVHVPGESHPASSYDESQERDEHFAGLNEHHDHTISPDLTITVHSQDSLEAQRITSGEANLGKVPPIWVPDSVATHCMNCGLKFSVIRRRHHCRACGKRRRHYLTLVCNICEAAPRSLFGFPNGFNESLVALCSSCCNMKFLLPYMNNKEGRVCQICCNALLRAQALMQVVDNQANENIRGNDDSPTDELLLDNGLEEEEEEEEEQLPLHDHEDAVEQEITEGPEPVGEVGEDTTENDFPGATGQDFVRERAAPVLPPLQIPITLPQDMGDTPLATPTSPALSDDSDCLFRLDVDNVRSLLPQDITALPPVLKVINGEISIQERPDPAEVMYQIKGLHETVAFLLNKNLVVKVSIVKLSCCVKHKCWCFVTDGMGAANQEEMVVLLECLRKETMLPKDVLSHFNTAFAYAKQGHTVSELGYTIFGQPFLGSSDNAGFLYVKPTYQCLKKLPLPSTPYVVGILIKRQETPWAQLFPLRLQLRLGAEYRYYPCPLFSSRTRPSVYGEVGHTIMNLLADFKNFQYTLARVTGLVIHMEEKRTLVRLPQDRYDEVVKILNASDEHVMALGANFSLQADSHLVCIQSEQGYKTQAINIQNQPRKVTGASFIVFSGAVKSSSPFMAKVSIVEDGIMVQMLPEAITKLRSSLKEMKDYTITTGIPGGGGEEEVIVEWVSRKDAPRQSSLCSPVDGLQLDGFPSVKVHSGYDFTRKNAYRIQWMEMYFLGEGQQSASRDLNKLTAEVAKAFARTLMPHLQKLSSDNCTFLGLRVSLDSENVGFLTGSNQRSLPASILSDLDDVLVPVLHAAASHHRGSAINVELLFKILRLL